jgi:hypothetical protein
MASEDALLLRNMRGASGEASVPLNVPEVEPEAVVEPEDGGSLVDLRSKYQGLSSTESRPMYRGFEVPAGMDLDRVNDWFAAIDVREDAREAREAEPYLTRTPEPWEGQFLEQMKGLSLEASKEEQRFLRDPAGRAEVYKDWAGDVYEDVMAGDPETIRNVADVSSLVDITGASDVTSAVQSGRLAYREPDKRGSHLTDAAISGTAGGIQSIATLFGAAPLVGSLLSGARLKAAMRGADVAEDVSDVAKVAPAAKLGGSGHFSDEAFEQTRKATSPAGSRETLVYMDIDEFLSLAAKGERKDSVEAVEKLIDEGTKFRNLPHLKFDESGKIFGHEGRHRAQALKERGVEKIPVVVESNDIRWQKQAEDTPDRVDFPEFLVSEDGKKKIKFPFELEGPNRGKPLPEYSADVAKAVPDAPAPVFESVLEKAVAESMPAKIGVDDVEQFLNKKGAKKSEIVDTKVPEFVAAAKAVGKKSISKDELIKHLDDNKVQIEEVRLSDTVPLPQEVRDLGVKKLEASRALRSEVESLSGVLAPGENLGTHLHKFEQNPSHFNNLYVGYVSAIRDIRMFENVPSDMSGVVNRLIDLDRNFSVSDWKVEDAARFTEARNAVNAKLADPEYQEFVRSRKNQMQRRRTEAEDDLIQADLLRAQNLKRVGRLLDRMPEAESRLAALRKFQNLPKYQEYSSLHRQHTTKLRAAAPEIEKQRTKWDEYTVPGGEDYQEILLTVPVAESSKRAVAHSKYMEAATRAREADQRLNVSFLRGRDDLTPLEQELVDAHIEYERFNSGVFAGEYDTSKVFTGSHHSNIPNVMVHIRTKDRVDSKGRKILFVEEIQSDWHQKGLKRGYQGQPIEELIPLETALARFERETELVRDWSRENPVTDSIELGRRLEFDDELFADGLALGDVVGDARKAKIDSMSPKMKKAWSDFTEWERSRYKFYEEGKKRVSEHGRFIERTPLQDAQADVVNAGDRVGLRLTATVEGAGADLRPGFTYPNRSNLLEANDLRRDAAALLGKNRIPDAPLKDTKEWTSLAIKRIFREAADKGYDGVAFSRADMITPVVTLPPGEAVAVMGNPEAFLERLNDLKMRGGHHEEGAEQAEKVFKGNQYFYDKLIPSIAKKETKAKQGTTDIGYRLTEDQQREISALRKEINTEVIEDPNQGPLDEWDRIAGVEPPVEEVNRVKLLNEKIKSIENNPGDTLRVPFFELTDKVRDRVIKPQKLYSLALPGIAVGAAAAEEEELSAAAALGAIGMGGMALYKGMKGARAADVAKTVDDAEKPDALLRKRIDDAVKAGSKTKKEAAEAAKLWKEKGVDSKYFKRWFKKSKIADSSGTPVRVYHGTNKNFDAFEVSGDKTGLYGQGVYVTVSPSVADGYASHVANQRWGQLSKPSPPVIGGGFESARGGSVIPGYVSVQNPLFVEDPLDGEVLRKMNDYLVERGYSGLDQDLNLTFRDLLFHIDEQTYRNMVNKAAVQRKLKKMVEEEGYDAVINSTESVFNASKDIDFKNAPHSMHIVLMNPTQFKSDIGNLGTFDPKDPRILYGAGAAVPAAAAVRSQRTEEEGNPAPDEPMEEAPYEPYYTGDDYVQSYELSDSRQVYDEQIGLQSRFDELTNELGMVEAEYYSLTDAERASKRGDVLHEWYNDRLDELSSVEEQLEPDGYLRFLKGEDYYYETSPYSLDDFDARRAFDVTGSAGPKIAENIELRSAQELHQVGLFQSTVDMGGPMVHMSGRNGAMNRFVYNKAQEFNHPVQTIQLNRPDKLSLMKDIDNVQSLKDAGLISFLLYKELLGDVKLY